MNDTDDSDSDLSELERILTSELRLLTKLKQISNLRLCKLKICGKHRTHKPLDFLIRGTPRTKYGILLMTTDGNAVETPKRKGQHKDIYNNRLFVLEVTIPEGGEYKFSLDHCETSSQHNNKPFQYLAVQLDDDGNLPLNRGEFVQYEKTLSSCPFWVESRDDRPKKLEDIVGPLPLIENVELQVDSIKRAFSMLPRRDTKPMAPNEEIRLLEMRVTYFDLKRCKECALNLNVYRFCSKCKRVEVSEPVDVEGAGSSSPLSSPSLSSSASQMSEHVDQRRERLLEETSRKRPHDEMAENEEDVAERKRFEELYEEELRSGGDRFLPNSADLKDISIVNGKVEFKSYHSFAGGTDSSNSQDSYTINEDSSCGELYLC